MVYIPDDWYVDINNRDRVRDVIDKYMSTTINFDPQPIIRALSDIGETKILDKFKEGTLTFG